MTKIGRNDPCHCGSGKKYKKCCLAKDEQQAQQAASAAALPLLNNLAPFPLSTPQPGQQTVAPEAGEDHWAAFEAADWEGRAAIFRDRLTAGLLGGSDEAFEMLNELRAEAEANPKMRADFFTLLQEFRLREPDIYAHDFGLYNVWLSKDLLEQGRADELAEVLEPFARSPGRFADQFFELIRLLMYHGQTGPLLPTMRQAWPLVRRSRQLMGWAIDEFASILSALTVCDSLESATSPSPDDPALLEALSQIGERDAETDRLNVLAVLGQLPEPPRLEDFSSSSDKAELFQRLILLSLEWIGDLRREHGVPLSKGELARLALIDYLFQRADRGKRGEELLVPEPQSFHQYLEARLSARLDAVYDVGSLLELLPRYLDYLIGRGVLAGDQAGQVLEALHEVPDAMVAAMRQRRSSPLVIRTVERAWQDTSVSPEGRIRHDRRDTAPFSGGLI